MHSYSEHSSQRPTILWDQWSAAHRSSNARTSSTWRTARHRGNALHRKQTNQKTARTRQLPVWTHTHTQANASPVRTWEAVSGAYVPMRAWNRLLWKMSMTLWMECRSCRSSARCSRARYSSSSTRARCASERQQKETASQTRSELDVVLDFTAHQEHFELHK